MCFLGESQDGLVEVTGVKFLQPAMCVSGIEIIMFTMDVCASV